MLNATKIILSWHFSFHKHAGVVWMNIFSKQIPLLKVKICCVMMAVSTWEKRIKKWMKKDFHVKISQHHILLSYEIIYISHPSKNIYIFICIHTCIYIYIYYIYCIYHIYIIYIYIYMYIYICTYIYRVIMKLKIHFFTSNILT